METLFGPAIVAGEQFAGLPLSGTITSRFGARDISEHANGHTGLDIAAPLGTAVRAPAPGVVLEAVQGAGVFGTYVTLRHRGALVSLYAHLSRLDVAPAQRLRPGDGLGLVGITGLSTGPHLHWALAASGSPLSAGPHLRDPLLFVTAAPERFDRERLFAAVGLGIMGALQAAGAAMDSHELADFAGYPEGSPELDILNVQRAADRLIARGLARWGAGT